MENELKIETTDLAYHEAIAVNATLTNWFTALDSKAVTVFTISGVIAPMLPLLRSAASKGWVGIIIVCWLLAAWFAFDVLRARDYNLDPNAKALYDAKWLSLAPSWYKHYRLKDSAETYAKNREAYLDKVKSLQCAIVATGAEITLLAIALAVG